MAVVIRLARVGARKQPYYRVVVADSRYPRDGRFIEILGHYNPRTNPETVKIDEGKVRGWLSKGARPSEAVSTLLSKLGILGRASEAKEAGGQEATAQGA